ncbi:MULTISPECIES: DUF4435 domain-containing protein [unclassified Luteibacter]|uniref:DUF4435 domain-containing protein n=1 Tax=Luteibacter sp. PvP019 TaxID=3156436 RepID=UPI0033952EC9
MAQLEYSLEALNVLRRFYRADVLVYVEGEDDIPFWSAVFNAAGGSTVVVEEVGGVAELDKLIERIEADDASLVVARDADYSLLSGSRSKSPRVIYSMGYSIENSLYTTAVIKRVAHLENRKMAPREEDIRAWLREIASALFPVVVNDIASCLDRLGVVALSDNCESFMVNRSSPLTSPSKIAARLATIEKKVSSASRARAEAVLKKHGGYHELMLRGHVLESAVVRFVQQHAGRNVARNTVYSTAMTMFESSLGRDHPHSEYYATAAKGALNNISQAA